MPGQLVRRRTLKLCSPRPSLQICSAPIPPWHRGASPLPCCVPPAFPCFQTQLGPGGTLLPHGAQRHKQSAKLHFSSYCMSARLLSPSSPVPVGRLRRRIVGAEGCDGSVQKKNYQGSAESCNTWTSLLTLSHHSTRKRMRTFGRALRCNSRCLALLGKDAGIKCPRWFFPASQSNPSHAFRTMKSAGLGGILPISSVQVKEIDFLCHRSVLLKAALCSVYCPELSC